MVNFSGSGSYLVCDGKDSEYVKRALCMINIYVNLSTKFTPTGYFRVVNTGVTHLSTSVIVKVVDVYRSDSTRHSTKIGTIGVRIIGRKEELIWVDYSDCHYRTITLSTPKTQFTIATLIRIAPNRRYSLSDVNPRNFVLKLST